MIRAEEEKHMQSMNNDTQKSNIGKYLNKKEENDKYNWRIHNLVSNVGIVSVQGTSDA